MTFKEFQATRRLCVDLTKHESDSVSTADHDPGQPGFVYGPLPSPCNLTQWLFIRIDGDGIFDTCIQGYPHSDCHLSLDEAEKQLYEFALFEGMIPG